MWTDGNDKNVNNKMKTDNRKIQIRLAPYSSDFKLVEYRIDPTELNWFQRLFNRWRNVNYFYEPRIIVPCDFYAYLDEHWGVLKVNIRKYTDLYEINSIEEVKDMFKTMQDINNFHKKQQFKYEKAYKEIEEKIKKISGYEY